MKQVPLRNRTGETVSHAFVDDEDYERVAGYFWSVGGNGYVRRATRLPSGKESKVYLHRELMGCAPGDGVEVDHENGNPLDCRRSNLRLATRAQNGQNLVVRGGSSRYRGVTWNKRRRKWQAQAMLNYRRHFLGYFDDEAKAAEAARAFRMAHMGYATN